IAVPPGTAFRAVSVGWNHACAVALDGAVWCWGDNRMGQTGGPIFAGPSYQDGRCRDEACPPPTRVDAGVVAELLAPGLFHTCVAAHSGAPSCWGWNLQGQLGL